ncbi:MAG: UPF0175 family protein [Rhodoferax sp.]|jgi:predicted HTH domain antitoxin|nr:UPF0175 family protein [Rhodoferax sp.]
MQIAIELPNDFVALQTELTIRHEMRTSYALWLFQRGRVTFAKAATLAGIDLYDFMTVCKENQVAVIDISRDELIQEINGLKSV